MPLPLPGQLRIERGTWRDYRTLCRFHYKPGHPRVPTQIWVVRYLGPCGPIRTPARPVAVAVVAFPTRFSSARHRVLHVSGITRRDLRFINKHIRTIARVIVHPQFRALGLSSLLVRCICKHCDTKYIEATAMMGRVHPLPGWDT